MPDLSASPSFSARHVPERSCVACRTKRPQAQFVRLVRTASGWTLASQDQRAGQQAGRGAYVCLDSPGCWTEKKLRRAFGVQATPLASQLQERGAFTLSLSTSAALS